MLPAVNWVTHNVWADTKTHTLENIQTYRNTHSGVSPVVESPAGDVTTASTIVCASVLILQG